ncbi:MAG: glycosyltransferase [Acidobacteria bacterium]|nr:glycosyltransferase [Acidobacteriota bacterium]
MRVSVVVPAYNEETLLGESLRRILVAMDAFGRAGWSSELIVCNNNSTDRTADIAAAAGARVVFEPVNQISRARNTGAEAATGDWLLFIDADSYPPPDLLSDVVRAIQSGEVMAGGSTVAVDSDHAAVQRIVGFWNTASRLTRMAAGSFIFCETAVFQEVGGFSQTLYAAEELELFRRLKREARRRHRRIVILDQHPLHTSGRKAHLYTARELIRFNLSVLFTGGRALRDPNAAHIWYDGRR